MMRVDEYRALAAAICCASAVLVLGSLLAFTGWEPLAWLATLALLGAYAFGMQAEAERIMREDVDEMRAYWLTIADDQDG